MSVEIIDFQPFLFKICTFKTINVLLSVALVLHLQKCICSFKKIIVIHFKYFSYSLSSLTHELFRRVLVNFQTYGDCLVIFLILIIT